MPTSFGFSSTRSEDEQKQFEENPDNQSPKEQEKETEEEAAPGLPTEPQPWEGLDLDDEAMYGGSWRLKSNDERLDPESKDKPNAKETRLNPETEPVEADSADVGLDTESENKSGQREMRINDSDSQLGDLNANEGVCGLENEEESGRDMIASSVVPDSQWYEPAEYGSIEELETSQPAVCLQSKHATIPDSNSPSNENTTSHNTTPKRRAASSDTRNQGRREMRNDFQSPSRQPLTRPSSPQQTNSALGTHGLASLHSSTSRVTENLRGQHTGHSNPMMSWRAGAHSGVQRQPVTIKPIAGSKREPDSNPFGAFMRPDYNPQILDGYDLLLEDIFHNDRVDLTNARPLPGIVQHQPLGMGLGGAYASAGSSASAMSNVPTVSKEYYLATTRGPLDTSISSSARPRLAFAPISKGWPINNGAAHEVASNQRHNLLHFNISEQLVEGHPWDSDFGISDPAKTDSG
ncbi:hypothetical protein PWT90_03754 [Aphanocladium album]|nr:hypothetical protein PWT90_03754 [Aphanocladium album]